MMMVRLHVYWEVKRFFDQFLVILDAESAADRVHSAVCARLVWKCRAVIHEDSRAISAPHITCYSKSAI